MLTSSLVATGHSRDVGFDILEISSGFVTMATDDWATKVGG
jgi:hypothetical protein